MLTMCDLFYSKGCISRHRLWVSVREKCYLFGCTGEYHQVEDVGGIQQSSAQSESKLQRLVYSTALKVTGRTEKLLLQAIYGQTLLRQVFFCQTCHTSFTLSASPKMQTEQLQIFICTRLKISNGS